MRLARMAAGLLVGVAVLTGCAGKQPANETLPAAAPTTADATPTLPPLGPPDMPMPAEAREKTSASATTFLRYYMNLLNVAQANLDPRYVSQLSQGCETCDRLIQNIEEDSRANREYQGGAISITSTSNPAIFGDEAQLAFSMEQGALTVRDADGKDVTDLSAPAAQLQCGAILRWSPTDSTWMLSQWDVN
jgi:Family of unknown function (DUF6318)